MSDRSDAIDLDDTDRNADWIKTLSWGIQPATVDRLLDVLGVDTADWNDQVAAVHTFMTLPAAEPMPDGLRAELDCLGLFSEKPPGTSPGGGSSSG